MLRELAQRFFRFRLILSRGGSKKDVLLTACSSLVPIAKDVVVVRLALLCQKKKKKNLRCQVAFNSLNRADMFRLSKLCHWSIVRTIRTHAFLGSPPDGAIAARYDAEQLISVPRICHHASGIKDAYRDTDDGTG